MRRIAVIGAGAAGLSAAWALAEAGAAVTLYERRAVAGGKLRTEQIDGASVDVAVQLISSTYTSFIGLAEAAGARALLQRSPGRDALWRKGRVHAITYGSVSSMVTSGALPTSLKLKLGAKYLPFLNAHARGLDANEPARGGAALDTESIAAWGRREMGDDFVDLLAYPLLAAYYGSPADEVTAPWYHALARVGMDVSVLGATRGFGAVAAAIVSALQARGVIVHTSREIAAVRTHAGGVRVEHAAVAAPSSHPEDSDGAVPSSQSEDAAVVGATSSHSEDADVAAASSHSEDADVIAATSSHSREDEFDGAVLAVPAPRARALLEAGGVLAQAPAALAQWLDAVRVRPAFTVCLRMDRPYPGDYFGLSFPLNSEAGDRVAALCIQSRKLPGLVPAGDALVVLPAPAAVPALLARSDDDIVAEVLRALERVVTGITRRVVRAHVVRIDDAYTLFDVGHLRRIVAFDAAWLPPTITLAGDYLAAPTVEGAARSGAAAARRLLR